MKDNPMPDIVELLRGGPNGASVCLDAAIEIERLRKINGNHCNAVNTLVVENSQQTDEIKRLLTDLKMAVQSDTEFCRVIEADNKRLRAALQYIADSEHWGVGVLVATAKQALTAANTQLSSETEHLL